MLCPNQDGVTHINIYSKGRTDFGKMLSNFYKFPISAVDGNFESVEGYWYWLNICECEDKEVLRKLYGFKAKDTGLKILQYTNCRWDNDFEKKITATIWYKFERNIHLLIDEYMDLPFEHYFVSGENIRDAKRRYPWMIGAIDKMRNYAYIKLKTSCHFFQ